MHDGCGCENSIHHRQWSRSRVQAAPCVCHERRNRQHATAVISRKAMKPPVERRRGCCVAPSYTFDSTPELTERQNTEPQRRSIGGFVPTSQTGRRAHAFAELRHDIRVEQESAFHRRTRRRGLLLGRVKSSSRPASGIARRSVLKDSASTSASSKIRRCSASAERPCDAARSFNLRTSVESTLRTMSCAIAINDSTCERH